MPTLTPFTDLMSPSRLFQARADNQRDRAETLKQIGEAHSRLRDLDRECDRLDCVIARHLKLDPGRAVRSLTYAGCLSQDYVLQLIDGVVDCRPCVDDHSLDRLPEDEVKAAIDEHERFIAKIRDAGRRFTPEQVQDAALMMAMSQVFGADAVTDSPSDDDTDEYESVASGVSVIDKEAS